MRGSIAKLGLVVLAGLAVTAIALALTLPEHRRLAGQTYPIQDRIWLNTLAQWTGDGANRELHVELMSIWGSGDVYFVHHRIKEFCDAVLANLPPHRQDPVSAADVRYVSLGLSRVWRAWTDEPVRVRVEDGECTLDLEAEPVSEEKPKVRQPSRSEAELNSALLANWRNVGSSFLMGGGRQGMHFEFVPKGPETAIDTFDFRQACRLALSRMPERLNSRLGILNFLETGMVSLRVWQREQVNSNDIPPYLDREFMVVKRDCAPTDGDA